MTRYIVKVHGNKHCPDGQCHPETASDWEGGTLVVHKRAPRTINDTKRSGKWIPSQGDELWIWTHESVEYGAGKGLTARAAIGSVDICEDKLELVLCDVVLVDTPVTLAAMKQRSEYGPVIERLVRSRHPDIYILSDDEYEGFRDDTERRTDGQNPLDTKMRELGQSILSRTS